MRKAKFACAETYMTHILLKVPCIYMFFIVMLLWTTYVWRVTRCFASGFCILHYIVVNYIMHIFYVDVYFTKEVVNRNHKNMN